MKQWLKEFIHNCVVHPLLPFMPSKYANRLHEWHGDWTFGIQELARFERVGGE